MNTAVVIPKVQITEVWAQLMLCDEDCARIRDFFVSEVGIKPRCIVRNMHITVYYARRPMPRVASVTESTHVVIAASETRFMVMAPGGENAKPDLEPGRRKVGLRVHKQSIVLPTILAFRDRLLKYETERVLGRRSPSTHKTNAFGARHYQSHMTVLRPGSGIHHDLTLIGNLFREVIGELNFDRFIIDVVTKASEGSSNNRMV